MERSLNTGQAQRRTNGRAWLHGAVWFVGVLVAGFVLPLLVGAICLGILCDGGISDSGCTELQREDYFISGLVSTFHGATYLVPAIVAALVVGFVRPRWKSVELYVAAFIGSILAMSVWISIIGCKAAYFGTWRGEIPPSLLIGPAALIAGGILGVFACLILGTIRWILSAIRRHARPTRDGHL
jgi:hypothetical protein